MKTIVSLAYYFIVVNYLKKICYTKDMEKKYTCRRLYKSILILIIATVAVVSTAHAQTVDELKQSITERNTKIEDLEKEIDVYQKELIEIGGEKQTLQTAVRSLDISRRKLGTDIKVTQNRIYSTALQIDELDIGIEDKEEKIAENIAAVAQTIRTIHEIESDSFIEVFLAHDNLADFWDELETLQRFQVVMRDEVVRLTQLKNDLEGKKQQSQTKKRDLTSFNKELSNQKIVLDINRQEKNSLLQVTKNKESNYEKLLEEKIELRKQFERELFDFESQLELIIDPASIPKTQSGILAWPLKAVKITQYFGNTRFASENPQVYSGKGHNGIDLRASSGTKVLAALSGTVEDKGDTDVVCRNASYGKWVLIKHNNGLTTLYAHLSLISVDRGESLSTGDIVGYSGNTGYSTGPHLHFTVYASQGVRVDKLKSRVCGGTYILPLADLKAYLNPLSYL